ncbi:MAG: HEAT repeat domain-containing protein [Vampirovibrionales bacterium]|nr:HEAT repeat domain-containing protein [Vampirovibrionales bacterium]
MTPNPFATLETIAVALGSAEAIASTERPARWQAVMALSKGIEQFRTDPRTLVMLCEAMTHETDCRIMQQCVLLIAQLKPLSAVRQLILIAMADDDGEALAVYKPPHGPVIKSGDDGMRLRVAAIRALALIKDERAIEPLMAILNNREDNYRVRLAAADALGKLGNQQAVAPLLEIVNDDRERSAYLKESAIQALGVLGDLRAMTPLIDMLESKRGFRDKFQFLVEKVVEAIGRIGNHADQDIPEAVRSLLKALDDDAPSIRLAAVESLGWMGQRVSRDALEALQARVFDTNDEVALAAVDAVTEVGGLHALQELLEHENLPNQLREAVLQAIMNIQLE